jgi:hypothetical protein
VSERSALVAQMRHARPDGAEDFMGDGPGPFGDDETSMSVASLKQFFLTPSTSPIDLQLNL